MQQGDVLRNNRENGNSEQVLHVLHCFDAGIEILDEKGEPEPNDNSHERAERQVQSHTRTSGVAGRLRDLFDADRDARHGQFHGLGLGTRAHAIEQQFFLDVSILGPRVTGV